MKKLNLLFIGLILIACICPVHGADPNDMTDPLSWILKYFRGSNGAPGPQGEPGITTIISNETGPAGPQGIPGPQGIQGIQGIPGPMNQTPGAKGDKGDQGDQGIQGVPGPMDDNVSFINGTRPFTANLSMASHYINGVLSPSISTDAANKDYVDSVNTSMKGYVDAVNSTVPSPVDTSPFYFINTSRALTGQDIKRSDNNSYLGFMAGTNLYGGASGIFRAKDSAYNPGGFELFMTSPDGVARAVISAWQSGSNHFTLNLVNASFQSYGVAWMTQQLKRTVNNDYTQLISGDTVNTAGASITLFGAQNAAHPGDLLLRVPDGANSYKTVLSVLGNTTTPVLDHGGFRVSNVGAATTNGDALSYDDYTAWTPVVTWTGNSSAVTTAGTWRYQQTGKTVTISTTTYATDCKGATGITVTLPVNAKTISSHNTALSGIERYGAAGTTYAPVSAYIRHDSSKENLIQVYDLKAGTSGQILVLQVAGSYEVA